MAKFPTEVERSITVNDPITQAYEYLWDVVGSSPCIEGLQTCKRVDDDTYRFIFKERSTGPVSMIVRYTARYNGNGTDRISFEGVGASDDNTDVSGSIRLHADGDKTCIVIRQMVAPETPIPRLVQVLINSFVETEAAEAVRQYLSNVKRGLEGGGKPKRAKPKA